jgi:hypothetical protein
MREDAPPSRATDAAVEPRVAPLTPSGDAPSQAGMDPLAHLLVILIILISLLAAVLLARETVTLLWHDAGSWGALWPTGAARSASPLFGLGAFVLWTLPLVAVVVLAHECGHAVGGYFAGFWLSSIQVGVFMLTRDNRGLRLGLSKDGWGGGRTAGYPVGEQSLLAREALFVALGPASNLVLAFVCAEVGHASIMVLPPNATVFALLYALAALNCATCIGSLIPYKVKRLRTDGWLLLHLLVDQQTMERALVFAALRGYTLREVPPHERPPSLVPLALALASSRAEKHAAAVYAYSHASDTGDFDTAGRMLDQLIAATDPPGPTGTMAHEIAYFAARHGGDPTSARTWLERGAGDPFASTMRPRALAAILLAEGSYTEARVQAAEGVVAFAAFTRATGRRHARDAAQVRAMLEEAERALASGS